MKSRFLLFIGTCLLALTSCRQSINLEITDFKYYDVKASDTVKRDPLVAVTNEDYLQDGSRVAYIDLKGDTIIPLGQYAYFGTDTLIHFASVIEHPSDSVYNRQIAIDRNQNILFDMIMFNNGPESFHDGLLRVLRNGKMGYANRFGQIVIPCIYDYASWFENGQAEVTFKAKKYLDTENHEHVESNEWFDIDRKGNRIE